MVRIFGDCAFGWNCFGIRATVAAMKRTLVYEELGARLSVCFDTSDMSELEIGLRDDDDHVSVTVPHIMLKRFARDIAVQLSEIEKTEARAQPKLVKKASW